MRRGKLNLVFSILKWSTLGVLGRQGENRARSKKFELVERRGQGKKPVNKMEKEGRPGEEHSERSEDNQAS